MNIQWFPGHMTKAIRMMEENLRLVDALICVIDSRAVFSSNNPLFDKLIAGKRVLYVFNKCDLVEESDLAAWCAEFGSEGKRYVKAVGTSGDCSAIVAGLKRIAADKIAKFGERGANVSVRAMVVGVPNSGKSTVINAMCKRAGAVTGDRPGVTRGKQWMSIDGVDLLDTPGTLWGKFEDESVAKHLAYIGSIRDEVLDAGEIAYAFLDEVREEYGGLIAARYSLDSLPDDTLALFDAIAAARGFKVRGGEPDYERTAKCIMDDFRKGRLGKIMLEKPKKQGLVLKKRG